MLKNYLTIALRNLRRHKGYAFINVTGLAVGLACCLLIFLYVEHEHSYDHFHEHTDRIYRLVNDVRLPSGETQSANTSAPFGPGMAAAFPEVETMVRLAQPRASFLFAYQGQRYEEQHLLFADSTLFEVFSFPLLRGDSETALKAPFSLVLTQQAAHKYFGDGNPIGQTLVADRERLFTVTGVLAEVPTTSHLQFDGLISMATAEQMGTFFFADVLDLRFATYLLLRDGAQAARLEAKFSDFVERTLGDIQRQNNFFYTFALVPVAEVYLHAEHRGLGVQGSRANLYTFSAIALFTLLIACINFMNLATARSAERAREVGVRKVVGAQRRQLAGQFLGESVLLCMIALGVALLLAWLFRPLFTALADTPLTMATLGQPAYLLGLLGGVIGVGILAGSYPALVLSGFLPVVVLKGRFLASRRGAALRRGLVVFQFATSVVLIVGTAIVYQQLRFMQQQRLGFQSKQMLVIDFQGDAQVQRQIEIVKEELRRTPGVLAATASWNVPGASVLEALTRVEAADGMLREIMMPVYPVDFDFLAQYDHEIVAGRAFSTAFSTDSSGAFIVNEAAVREFGYRSPDELIGKPFTQWGQEGEVVGVVEDFHYTSLRQAIKPMNFRIGTAPRYLTLRITTDDLQRTVAAVEQTWQRLVSHRPFTYRFLDVALDAQYHAEERFGRIVGSFAVLAVLVACLGLFGLATFTAQRRTKEIGIRKVLGATVSGIVTLLSTDFLKLVMLAFAVATPMAYGVMNRWLEDFAYRIDLSWLVFLGAGLAALVMAALAVSYQAVKAALADPVKALRYE